MNIAENIKKLRLHLVMDQKQFGELIGITGSAISNYEGGRRIPKMVVIRELLEIAKKNKVKMSFEDFYNDKE